MCRRLEPSPRSHVTPTTSPAAATNHATTRKPTAASPEPVRGEGAGRAWVAGGGVAAALVALFLVAFAVYRYRRCYEGSYDVDAELPMNGYVPSACAGAGETATLSKRNGGVKSVSHSCTVSRSSKELYV